MELKGEGVSALKCSKHEEGDKEGVSPTIEYSIGCIIPIRHTDQWQI